MDQAPVLARRIKTLVERRRGEDLALAITNAEEDAVAVEMGGEIIYANSPFELLVSRELTEIIGKSLTSFTVNDERPSLQANLKKGGESNLTILRPDGSQRSAGQTYLRLSC